LKKYFFHFFPKAKEGNLLLQKRGEVNSLNEKKEVNETLCSSSREPTRERERERERVETFFAPLLLSKEGHVCLVLLQGILSLSLSYLMLLFVG